MKTALQILKDARALISDPIHWRRGDYITRGPNGVTSYCAVGAVNQACGLYDNVRPSNEYSGSRHRAFDCLARYTPGHLAITTFNDMHGHEDVLALFDAAIASGCDAKEEEAA